MPNSGPARRGCPLCHEGACQEPAQSGPERAGAWLWAGARWTHRPWRAAEPRGRPEAGAEPALGLLLHHAYSPQPSHQRPLDQGCSKCFRGPQPHAAAHSHARVSRSRPGTPGLGHCPTKVPIGTPPSQAPMLPPSRPGQQRSQRHCGATRLSARSKLMLPRENLRGQTWTRGQLACRVLSTRAVE